MKKIIITAEDKIIHATLNDTVAAQDFEKRLPFKCSCNDSVLIAVEQHRLEVLIQMKHRMVGKMEILPYGRDGLHYFMRERRTQKAIKI